MIELYNTERPHQALGYKAPAMFAAQLAAISFAHPTRCADRPLLRQRIRAKFNPGLWRQPDERRGSQHTQC